MKSRQVDAEVDLTQFAEKDERCCGTNRNASDASKTATLSFITALIANVLTPLHGVVGSNASTVHKLFFFLSCHDSAPAPIGFVETSHACWNAANYFHVFEFFYFLHHSLSIQHLKLFFVVIKVLEWTQQLSNENEPREEFWMLRRCLPGQSNASLRWSDYFGGLARQRQFEPCRSIPTIYRHQKRQMFMNVHIDDILLIGLTEDCEWFENEFNEVVKMKNDGPCMWSWR